MRLKECQGKKLLKKYGISIPRGKLITSIDSFKFDSSYLAKAQVLAGRRKKKGLIKTATRENLKKLFCHCQEVLLEEKLEIEKEYYLALTIDRELKEIVVLFSEDGGIEVEGSGKITKFPLPESRSKLPHKEFLPIIRSMSRLMKDYQALLVEINPLALVRGELIALDAKIILDDEMSQKHDSSYVELDGEIAVIGNGAGLVMATLDTIDYFGGQPACFLDLGGGASQQRMKEALKIVFAKKPKTVLINVFGGITCCDEIAQGLVDYKNENKPNVPLIVRMVGTKEIEAREILTKNGIDGFDSMEKAVLKAVKKCRS